MCTKHIIICCPNPSFKTPPHSLHTHNLGNLNKMALLLALTEAFMGPITGPALPLCPVTLTVQMAVHSGLTSDTGQSAEKPPRESKLMRNITYSSKILLQCGLGTPVGWRDDLVYKMPTGIPSYHLRAVPLGTVAGSRHCSGGDGVSWNDGSVANNCCVRMRASIQTSHLGGGGRGSVVQSAHYSYTGCSLSSSQLPGTPAPRDSKTSPILSSTGTWGHTHTWAGSHKVHAYNLRKNFQGHRL